jgi:hypothetical protein
MNNLGNTWCISRCNKEDTKLYDVLTCKNMN